MNDSIPVDYPDDDEWPSTPPSAGWTDFGLVLAAVLAVIMALAVR